MNAKTLKVEFTRPDGSTIKLTRKLNMIAVVSLYYKVNKKTVQKVTYKFKSSLKQ